MSNDLAERIHFLKESGIDDLGHSGEGLLDHLLGTRELLERWGARQALCDAGLFHSVYGTEAYKATTIPLSMRDSVRGIIGEEAEMLAWLFGIMKRTTLRTNLEREKDFQVRNRLTDEWIPLSAEQFSDLANLEAANGLEQLPRLPAEYKTKAITLLDFRRYLMPAAMKAVQEFCASIDQPVVVAPLLTSHSLLPTGKEAGQHVDNRL